jgi:hypothetical protein
VAVYHRFNRLLMETLGHFFTTFSAICTPSFLFLPILLKQKSYSTHL